LQNIDEAPKRTVDGTHRYYPWGTWVAVFGTFFSLAAVGIVSWRCLP
jgi:hypothetical protein